MNSYLKTQTSDYDFATSLARIKAAIAAQELSLFACIDHSAAATAAGLQLTPTVVLLFGSPKMGTALMAQHPTLALDMPFRVALVATATGVQVSYRQAQALAEHGVAAANLQALAKLAALVDAAIKAS